jgi:HTH-type transcriptional regulator/antitoxin MqsA
MKNCPECGAPSPVHATRDVLYIYKGKNTTIPAVTGHHCSACGEITLDKEEVDRYGDMVAAFHRQVNGEVVDPIYVLTVRKKLGLDQREAGSIFGGGDNAFSRYENGKTSPPVALVKLLRLLDRHPELLAEVRG